MAICPECGTHMEDSARFCPECGHQMKEIPQADLAAGLATIGGLETLDDVPTGGGRSKSTPALEPGAEFAGRYMINAVVGRGGMGVVYKAEDDLTKQTVALKLIRPERLSGTKAIERLIAEGVTARDIRHPNIVAVYDVGSNEGQPYVSMEYLDGESLRSWHRKKMQAREDVPLKVAAKIISEVLEGLQAAHKAGVIHRDLKPENVVLLAEPTEDAAPLKILDFGIARATGGALESGTGTGLGTPRYMAPEQITNPDAAGASADLYSLSVMFYELLVDVLPQGHWQPPSGGRSDVPQKIDSLIEKGLSNRPANRPQDTSAYASLLSDALKRPVEPKKIVEDNNGPKSNNFWENYDREKVKKWAWWVLGGLVVLFIIDELLPDTDTDPCEGLYGAAYEECVFYELGDNQLTDGSSDQERITARLSENRETEPAVEVAEIDKAAQEAEAREAARRQAEAEKAEQAAAAARERERAAQETRRREDNDWSNAQRQNTASAYQNYLNAWPTGRYSATARSKIASLRPPPNRYAYLSGVWKLDDGTYYNMTVSSSGSFSGSGRGSDGTALQLSGRFSGNTGPYSLNLPAMGITLNGQFQWDGACHINYSGQNSWGAPVSGQIHVRHNPGVTVCPT